MGMYKHLKQNWRKSEDSGIQQQKIIQWRQEPVTMRIDHPTRLDRSRSLGYKAKQGFIIIRQRVSRGGRQRPKIREGRRSKRSSRRKDLRMSYQWVAEERAVKKYINCEVLNSYYVGEDGTNYWYEVILVDRTSPTILADKNINWIFNHRGRVYRGLTSAAKHSRMILNKKKG